MCETQLLLVSFEMYVPELCLDIILLVDRLCGGNACLNIE